MPCGVAREIARPGARQGEKLGDAQGGAGNAVFPMDREGAPAAVAGAAVRAPHAQAAGDALTALWCESPQEAVADERVDALAMRAAPEAQGDAEVCEVGRSGVEPAGEFHGPTLPAMATPGRPRRLRIPGVFTTCRSYGSASPAASKSACASTTSGETPTASGLPGTQVLEELNLLAPSSIPRSFSEV